MSRLRAWWQAIRPSAQTNIALPLFLGQAWAYGAGYAFEGDRCLALLIWGVLNQWVIVFVNDIADEKTDRDNTTFNLTSGGSRVLVDGVLTTTSLKRATGIIGVLWIALSAAMAIQWQLPLVGVALLAAVLLLGSYSLSPLRLSYRGGGEFLQALGVGVVLPSLGYYVQGGRLETLHPGALAALFLLGLGSGISTALADTPSDARSSKRTMPVSLGELPARSLSLVSLGLAIALASLCSPTLSSQAQLWLIFAPGLILCSNLLRIRRSDANAPKQCTRFVLTNLGAQITLQLIWALGSIGYL